LKISTWNSSVPLLGIHQVETLPLRIAGLNASGLKITDDEIRTGFAEVRWPARFEVVRRDPP